MGQKKPVATFAAHAPADGCRRRVVAPIDIARTAPWMPLPVSCAMSRCCQGEVPAVSACGARVSTQTGVPWAMNARSTAIERRGVGMTPCEPTAPGSLDSLKNTNDGL